MVWRGQRNGSLDRILGFLGRSRYFSIQETLPPEKNIVLLLVLMY
jgi:hypothetical protein